MPPDSPPKPCCKIGPVSVIENALRTYEEAGIHQHVVVVGYRAEEVMAEVCRSRPDVLFAFQPERRGTGDAVRCAMDLMEAAGEPKHVFICAGDKVMEPRVVRGMLEAYLAADDGLCLLAGPGEHYAYAGRLIVREGSVRAIIELADLHVRQLAGALRTLGPEARPRTVGEFRGLAATYVKRVAKLGRYLPALAAMLDQPPDAELPWGDVEAAMADLGPGFPMRSGQVSLEEAAAAKLCNLSVYAGRFGLLHDHVRELKTDNVQNECYFTDVVDAVASEGRRVGLVRMDDPDEVMAFNTPEELEQVRQVHAVRAQRRVRYPTVQQWTNYLDWQGSGGPVMSAVQGLAGRVGQERGCILVRSPGRINLMGRHVDHQGGRCNLMAIDREVVLAAAPREDDRINIWNADPAAYPDRSFTLAQVTADVVWEDWLRTLDSQYLQRMVSGSAGDWANYVKGAALRLQHRFRDRPLKGMDAFVCGDIPVAAGLSSSSALVVAVAEALTELNALNVHAREFVDLCGEGEWFVGTRSGSGDHAVIKFGREKEVLAVSFFPFEVVGQYPFPEDCALLICRSGVPADIGEEGRERLSARVACCHLAREVVREARPEFADRIDHLRDLNAEALGLSLPALYELIKGIPNDVPAREIEGLARRHEALAGAVSVLQIGRNEFPLRDVALYVVAECERSLRTAGLLDRGDMAALGETMSVSHDGERVARWRPDRAPFDSRATDERMQSLIRRAVSLAPLQESGAALWQQPGAYDCSTAQIDLMIDRVLSCPGVHGAQLAGAGLGGCIMVLVQRDAVEQAQRTLELQYYEPAGIEPGMFVCEPSRGSQVLTTVGASH